jgi:hypothetical protein
MAAFVFSVLAKKIKKDKREFQNFKAWIFLPSLFRGKERKKM